MPLKPCRECNREISTDARSCPHCGKRAPTGTPPSAKGAAIAFFGFVAILAVYFQNTPAPEPGQSVEAVSNAASAMSEQRRRDTLQGEFEGISVGGIVRQYERNTLAADRTYQKKRMLIGGYAGRIDEGWMSGIYITITANPTSLLPSLQARLAPGEQSLALELSAGDPLLLICTIGGVVVTFPMLESCTIQTTMPNFAQAHSVIMSGN